MSPLIYDEARRDWLVETDTGESFVARYVIAATGCLSAPLTPSIDGIDSFAGVSLFTSLFPKEGFDFSGKRVAVIGTGSSGVQTVPVVAEQADHLYVFQRSAAFTRPANNRPIDPDEMQAIKADYPDLRRRQLEAFAGTLRFGAVTIAPVDEAEKILDAPIEARMSKVDDLGWGAPWAWSDVMFDMEANRAGVELYGELIRRHVADPEVAESLVPHYPIGCKRLILDTGYFETFNRDNATLIDLRKDAIRCITPTGVLTEQRALRRRRDRVRDGLRRDDRRTQPHRYPWARRSTAARACGPMVRAPCSACRSPASPTSSRSPGRAARRSTPTWSWRSNNTSTGSRTASCIYAKTQ